MELQLFKDEHQEHEESRIQRPHALKVNLSIRSASVGSRKERKYTNIFMDCAMLGCTDVNNNQGATLELHDYKSVLTVQIWRRGQVCDTHLGSARIQVSELLQLAILRREFEFVCGMQQEVFSMSLDSLISV